MGSRNRFQALLLISAVALVSQSVSEAAFLQVNIIYPSSSVRFTRLPQHSSRGRQQLRSVVSVSDDAIYDSLNSYQIHLAKCFFEEIIWDSHGALVSLQSEYAELSLPRKKHCLKPSALEFFAATASLFNSPFDLSIQLMTLDSWRVILSLREGVTYLEMKTLLDDTSFQVGDNVMVVLPAATTQNCSVDIYPFFLPRRGTVVTVSGLFSPQLKNTRDIVVYLPPSYFENTLKNYSNVLVMHDGQNLFNVSTAFNNNPWDAGKTADQLIVEGYIDELIIVGVDNTPDRTNELTYSYDDTVKAGGKGDLYLDFIEQTVLPMIYSKFRAVPARDRLGILGSSLGGLISCYAGWTRPHFYSRAGCMSSSFWWNNEDFNNDVLAKKGPTNVLFYLDSGNAGPSEDDMKQTLRVRDHLLELGYSLNSTLFYYLDNGGEHNESFWRRRFHIPLEWLYPASVAKAKPTAL